MKSAYHLYIGTVKFSNLFQESPCSPVVTFPSFGSEGHGVQPPQGDSFFDISVKPFCMFFGTNAGVVLLVIVPFKKHQIT